MSIGSFALMSGRRPHHKTPAVRIAVRSFARRIVSLATRKTAPRAAQWAAERERRQSRGRCHVIVQIEEWLERMRQAREPGPMVRVVVVRNSRGAGWTFDLTEKTDLAELAERIEATIRDVNCTSCEMRAIDAEGRTIDNFPYRVETPGVAQLVTTPAATQLPFPVEESIGAVMKTHRSMTALNLQGIAENYDFAKQIITEQRKQITALVEAVAVARAEHAADVVALRKDYN